MTILIAEDEKVLAGVLKEEFEVEGFGVLVAENGNKTMELMRSKPKPDVLLLDLLMPEKDGFQVLEEINNDQTHNLKTTPVIVLSNLGQDEDIKRAFKLGATDYFVKAQHPITEVVEKVKKILEGGYRQPRKKK